MRKYTERNRVSFKKTREESIHMTQVMNPSKNIKADDPVRKLTLTALFMAMNIVMSSSILSVPVPGGHMYLNDVVIVTAAILLDPVHAALAGGIGAFIGDMLFYPAPMFVSLVVHGLQAFVISLFVHKIMPKRPEAASVIGSVTGLVITVTGYTLGRAFIYSTPEYAVAKFPFQILQTLVGSALALLLCWKCGIVNLFRRFTN